LPAEAHNTRPASNPGGPHEVAARRRPWWRGAVAGCLYHSGALRILETISRGYEIAPGNGRRLPHVRRSAHPRFAILCYHRIGTGGIPLFNGLPAEIFEAQMKFLRRRYRIISLDELCREMEQPIGKGHAIAVTFDDGYRDLYAHALPALRKYQIPATIFLPVTSIETGQVPWYDRIFLALKVFPKDKLEISLDRPRSFELSSLEARIEAASVIVQYLRTLPDERRKERCADLERQVVLPREELADRMLTWDQIRSMCAAGVTFGSHTMTHPVVSRLTAPQIESELRQSKAVMEERLGTPVRHFAFPFGQLQDCGTEALPILERCGYASAATTVAGINVPGESLFGLRRVQIGEEHSLAMFAFQLNRLLFSAASGDSAAASSVCSPSRSQARCDSGPAAQWRKRCGTS